jgi:hypothetical protein
VFAGRIIPATISTGQYLSIMVRPYVPNRSTTWIMKLVLFFLFVATATMRLVAQSAATDELAIRAVIERETQSYLDRNAGQQADCWSAHTGLSQRISLDNGHIVAADGDQVSLRRGLESCFRQLTEPDRATFTHQAYQIRIKGESAFVTFSQIMHPSNRPADYSHQIRYLEREQGQWKIVHSTVLYYEPTPEQAQAAR